jgi:hypothetical protein
VLLVDVAGMVAIPQAFHHAETTPLTKVELHHAVRLTKE